MSRADTGSHRISYQRGPADSRTRASLVRERIERADYSTRPAQRTALRRSPCRRRSSLRLEAPTAARARHFALGPSAETSAVARSESPSHARSPLSRRAGITQNAVSGPSLDESRGNDLHLGDQTRRSQRMLVALMLTRQYEGAAAPARYTSPSDASLSRTTMSVSRSAGSIA
jgi:hypothetical protein